MRKRATPFFVLVLILLLSVGILRFMSAPVATAVTDTPYNIVLILTDDQRWDSICASADSLAEICSLPTEEHPMPTIESELLLNGTYFSNAFVSNPICCPSRAGFLSGGFYSHHSNVLSNQKPNGGALKFADSDTLATLLQQHGYRTMLIGKYLNNYEDLQVEEGGYIPPGWSNWIVGIDGNWFDFSMVIGSSDPVSSSIGAIEQINDGSYLTDYEQDRMIEFLDEQCDVGSCNEPFFLFFSAKAPHEPAFPPERHQELFSDFTYRGRGYNEQPTGNLRDKPAYVRLKAAKWTPGSDDESYRNQLRSLRAVDEAVESIIENLRSKELLQNTVFIFASDNGYLWGEHKLNKKSLPYEESIRVPLIIWHPEYPNAVVDKLVTFDLDLAPTILEIAEISAPPSDGSSLLPLMADPAAPWREELLIEGYDDGRQLPIPIWAGIRTEDNWKYVEYATGERELYNLVEDPFELSSLHNDTASQEKLDELALRLDNLERGVAVTTENFAVPSRRRLPTARVGVSYTFQFGAWGGNGELLWSAFHDAVSCPGLMPAGLAIDANGLLSGVPTTAGNSSFCVKVQDTSDSPQPGNDRPQEHVQEVVLSIQGP